MLAGTRLANAWEETAVAPPAVPPLEGAQTANVLVIGAGYLGLSAALHLALEGVAVIVVDAEVPGGARRAAMVARSFPASNMIPASWELARIVTDPHYDPILPFSPVRPIPLHPLNAFGVATTIAAYRAVDGFGFR